MGNDSFGMEITDWNYYTGGGIHIRHFVLLCDNLFLTTLDIGFECKFLTHILLRM